MAAQALASFAEHSVGLAVGATPQPLGPLGAPTPVAAGVITVAGKEVFIPAGMMVTRTVGATQINFLVAASNLSGQVVPTALVGAATFALERPGLVATGTSCGGCAACGACSACALCGEVNFGVAGVAAAAVAAVAVVGGVAFEPSDRLKLMESGGKAPLKLLQANDLLNKIAKL